MAPRVPSARDVREFRLNVKVGGFTVAYHDDSSGHRYFYAVDPFGVRDEETFKSYREAVRYAWRSWKAYRAARWPHTYARPEGR